MANIVEQLKRELEEFDKSINVTESETDTGLRYLSDESNTYLFNQKKTLERIDRYYNSQFDSGKYDGEGQRKTFLNIVKFAADVAAKQTDIDVKNFTFIPSDPAHVDKVELLKRSFEKWVKDNDYGQLLNDLNNDYSKYGSVVVKKVGDRLERVPLRTLINTQDAHSLKQAVDGGGFVIQSHSLTPHQMRQFPDWDVPEGLIEGQKYMVYERHALVDPKGYDELDGEDLTLAVAYILLDGNAEGTEKVMFIEAEDELPFEEGHWAKQDGRWLGIGEVENQFENQIARNLSSNLRRRNMLWGAKKLFQSADSDMVGKNLIQDVSDGEILEVGPNGQIQPVNLATQHQSDYAQDDAVWDENSRQKSFMFEVTTGESLPSGTPFRLGVILSAASETHFNLKRENLAFFLKRSFFNQLMPIFQKEIRNKETRIALASTSEGIERIREAIVTKEVNERLKRKILDKNLTRNLESLGFNWEQEEETVRQELDKQPYFFVTGKPGIFEDIEYDMTLEITGEQVDINKKIETLSTLLQSLPPEDPRREDILERALMLTGQDTSFIKRNRGTITGNNLNQLMQNASPTNEGAAPSATSPIS